jgi:glycosyltransferase involved in cell wall biosynthesis
MKFVFFAPGDIQLPRVARQAIVSFCSAVAELGHDVELVGLRIRVRHDEPKAKDPLDLYRIRTRFRTRLTPVPIRQGSERAIPLVRLLVHAAKAVRLALFTPASKTVVLYTLTYSSAVMLSFVKRLARARVRVVLEAHVPPQSRLQRLALRRVDHVVANTYVLADELVAVGHVEADRVTGEHQGVDLDLFDEMRLEKDDARRRLGLPIDRRLAVYTGKIYVGYREVEHILEAAGLCEDRDDLHFLLVGGRADHVERLRERVVGEGRRNVTFLGFVPPTEVQWYQMAADALILYYPSGIALNAYRSPGKLFDYMASGRPIVAVDIPVLREVLGEEPAAVLAAQDDPDALSAAIRFVIDDTSRSQRLADEALLRVSNFTWKRRAVRLLAAIAADPKASVPGGQQISRRQAIMRSGGAVE